MGATRGTEANSHASAGEWSESGRLAIMARKGRFPTARGMRIHLTRWEWKEMMPERARTLMGPSVLESLFLSHLRLFGAADMAEISDMLATAVSIGFIGRGQSRSDAMARTLAYCPKDDEGEMKEYLLRLLFHCEPDARNPTELGALTARFSRFGFGDFLDVMSFFVNRLADTGTHMMFTREYGWYGRNRMRMLLAAIGRLSDDGPRMSPAVMGLRLADAWYDLLLGNHAVSGRSKKVMRRALAGAVDPPECLSDAAPTCIHTSVMPDDVIRILESDGTRDYAAVEGVLNGMRELWPESSMTVAVGKSADRRRPWWSPYTPSMDVMLRRCRRIGPAALAGALDVCDALIRAARNRRSADAVTLSVNGQRAAVGLPGDAIHLTTDMDGGIVSVSGASACADGLCRFDWDDVLSMTGMLRDGCPRDMVPESPRFCSGRSRTETAAATDRPEGARP